MAQTEEAGVPRKAGFQQFRIGDFLVEKKLGKGGMGVVFLAQELSLNRKVALKFLTRARADSESRLLAEARTVARLDHPNIVRVYTIGRDPARGRIFMAMEYVAGQSLKALIAQDTASFSDILEVGIGIAEGLAHSWSHKVVHRDIKPGNVMLTREERCVKILDFGLALFKVPGKSTRGELVAGTANYMSPEQSAGRDLDVRSDLYSLGVVLYEMLAGARPFAARTSQNLDFLHGFANPKRIRAVRPNVPAAFERILERLLAKSRENRYPDPQALLVDLRALQSRLARARRLDEQPLGPVVKPVMAHEADKLATSALLNTRRPQRRSRWWLPVLTVPLLAALGAWLLWGSSARVPTDPSQANWSEPVALFPQGPLPAAEPGVHWERSETAGTLLGRGTGFLSRPLGEGAAWKIELTIPAETAPSAGIFVMVGETPEVGLTVQRYSRLSLVSVELVLEDGSHARVLSQELAPELTQVEVSLVLLPGQVDILVQGEAFASRPLSGAAESVALYVEAPNASDQARFAELNLRKGQLTAP